MLCSVVEIFNFGRLNCILKRNVKKGSVENPEEPCLIFVSHNKACSWTRQISPPYTINKALFQAAARLHVVMSPVTS